MSLIILSYDYPVLTKQLGTDGKTWPNVEAWIRKIEQRPAYQETKKAAGLHDFTLEKL